MQLTDLEETGVIKNTEQSYMKWAQNDIVREMKEDFLFIQEDFEPVD